MNPRLYEGATRDLDAPPFGLDRDGRRAPVGARADRDGVTDGCNLDGSVDVAELRVRANSWELRSAPEGRNVESGSCLRLFPCSGGTAGRSDQPYRENRR